MTLTSKSSGNYGDLSPTRSQSSLCCEENYFLDVLIITIFPYLPWSLQKKGISNNCQQPANICHLWTHVQWTKNTRVPSSVQKGKLHVLYWRSVYFSFLLRCFCKKESDYWMTHKLKSENLYVALERAENNEKYRVRFSRVIFI